MEIKNAILQYEEIKKQEKLLSAKKKEVADYLKKYAQDNGTQDAKGSSYFNYEDFVLGRVAVTKIVFNQDKAYEFIQEKYGEDVLQQVLNTVTYVDEDKVGKVIEQGLLSIDDLENMVDKSTSYKIDLKQHKQEEETEKPKVTCKPKVKKMVRRK